MLKQLTKKQKAVFQFIRDKIDSRGYGPTVREIGEKFEIQSPNGVMCHLRALEKKGLITLEPNRSRAIQIASEFLESEIERKASENGCRLLRRPMKMTLYGRPRPS